MTKPSLDDMLHITLGEFCENSENYINLAFAGDISLHVSFGSGNGVILMNAEEYESMKQYVQTNTR